MAKWRSQANCTCFIIGREISVKSSDSLEPPEVQHQQEGETRVAHVENSASRYKFWYSPQSPACWTRVFFSWRHDFILRVQWFLYVTPSVPHTGVTMVGHSVGHWHSARPSAVCTQLAPYAQYVFSHGSTKTKSEYHEDAGGRSTNNKTARVTTHTTTMQVTLQIT